MKTVSGRKFQLPALLDHLRNVSPQYVSIKHDWALLTSPPASLQGRPLPAAAQWAPPARMTSATWASAQPACRTKPRGRSRSALLFPRPSFVMWCGKIPASCSLSRSVKIFYLVPESRPSLHLGAPEDTANVTASFPRQRDVGGKQGPAGGGFDRRERDWKQRVGTLLDKVSWLTVVHRSKRGSPVPPSPGRRWPPHGPFQNPPRPPFPCRMLLGGGLPRKARCNH